MSMTELMKCFDFAIKEKKKFVAVKVQLPGQEEPEIIINSNSSFKNKQEYYRNAYNDDLTLKANKDIKITEFAAFYGAVTFLNFIDLGE